MTLQEILAAQDPGPGTGQGAEEVAQLSCVEPLVR